jgi:hypothetical protein
VSPFKAKKAASPQNTGAKQNSKQPPVGLERIQP